MTSDPASIADAPLFVREDLDLVLADDAALARFRRFVLERFAAYTHSKQVHDQAGCYVHPIGDVFARTHGAYGLWHVRQDWATYAAPYDGESDDELVVVVEHVVRNSGATGRILSTVKVPLSFIFADPVRDAAQAAEQAAEQATYRAEYLRLKAMFEPTTINPVTINAVSNTALPVVGETPDAAKTAALREAADLLIEAAGRDINFVGSHQFAAADMLIANKDRAQQVYQRALTGALPAPGSHEDRQVAKVQAAAVVLGLNVQEPKHALPGAPSWKTSERVVAAHTLWRQARSLERANVGDYVHLANPANRDEVAQEYRTALKVLLDADGYDGSKAVRASVHGAARVLGLTPADLNELTIATPDTTQNIGRGTESTITSDPAASTEPNTGKAAPSDCPDSPYDDPRAEHSSTTKTDTTNSDTTRTGPGTKGRFPRDATSLFDTIFGVVADTITETITETARQANKADTTATQDTAKDAGAGRHAAPETNPADMVRDVAGDVYEKARAVMTLSGKSVFGDHAPAVVKVMDGVAEGFGLTKKR